MSRCCCPVCRRLVSKDALACPGCGHPRPAKGWSIPCGLIRKIIIGIIAMLILVNAICTEDLREGIVSDRDLDSVRVMKSVDGKLITINP